MHENKSTVGNHRLEQAEFNKFVYINKNTKNIYKEQEEQLCQD